jgi:hypothetical protein
VIVVALLWAGSQVSPWAKAKAIKALEERFDSDVELKTLSVSLSLFPRITAIGEGLVLRHKHRTDIPPMIVIPRFTAYSNFLSLIGTPIHITSVRLEGLNLHMPPKVRKDPAQKEQEKAEKQAKKAAQPDKPSAPLLIEEIIADATTLTTIPNKPGKNPLTWQLQTLTLKSVGVDRPMEFRSRLTNAKPPGLIYTTGHFGPFDADEPSNTPLDGDYKFENANLAVFKGISGTLASVGKFKGQLGSIEADGTTDVPDFTVTIAGHPVHLKAEFHSIIDGTDGDTLLQPVTGHFNRSSILAFGGVEGHEGVVGKTVTLDVTVKNARVEDMMKLAVKSAKPPMTGAIAFKTKLVIPPGDLDIARKLYLNGEFGIASGKFTDFKVQDRVEELSDRSRGQVGENASDDSVVSNLKGRFILKNGVLTFSKLTFNVPGADVAIEGNFGLMNESLDFHGIVKMQAKVSQMTTGFKSFLLKAVDPLLKRKNAGTVLAIKIGGTRSAPQFGLDVGKTFSRK